MVDDHLVVAETLRMAIDLEDGLDCVGIAGTVAVALELLGPVAARDGSAGDVDADDVGVDVVLMDVRLPGMDGIEGTRRVKARHPGVRVLILSAYTDLDVVERAASAGASGVLTKEGALADIVTAIRTANDGAVLIDMLALAPLVGDGIGRPSTTARASGLTRREHEVLALMGQGLNPKSIATRLGIGVETVRGHVKCILPKLGAHTQLEAVVTAVREGIVSPSSPSSPSSP